MKKFTTLTFLLLFLICFTFAGCDISLPKQNFSVSGNIFFQSIGLNEVKIKTKSKVLTETDNNGNFSFEVYSHSFEIFPEKDGYTFSPKSIEITKSTNEVVFCAQKIKDLNGDLSLSHIIITPTSIASSQYDNYLYSNNNQSCLKIKNINIDFNQNSFNLTNLNKMLIKNETNQIDFYQNIDIKTGKQFEFKFSVDAYYKFNQEEYLFTETVKSVLSVSKMQTTQNLDENNQISYTLVGVNSSNNRFSYNITFVFDYFPNI